MASARPGWPASRAASASVTNTTAAGATAVRGAAMPTTVAGSAGPVGGEAHARADAQVAAGREAGVDDDLAAARAARGRRAAP